MASNEAQIKYWNEEAGPKWVGLHERLDSQIGPIGDVMLARANPQPGEVVIDVGCGCGATTLAIAERVSPGGRVTGLDISGPMLERARVRAKTAGLDNARFVQADAQVEKLPAGEADLVTSRFGVMFFDDPVAAFSNLHAATKKGGRLAFVCWQPLGKNPWMSVPMAAALPLMPEPPAPPEPGAPGPFAFGDPDRVRSILGDAGYSKIEVDSHAAAMRVGGEGPLEETVDFMLRMGPTSRLLAEADDELIARANKAVFDALKPYQTSAGVELGGATWMVSAVS